MRHIQLTARIAAGIAAALLAAGCAAAPGHTRGQHLAPAARERPAARIPAGRTGPLPAGDAAPHLARPPRRLSPAWEFCAAGRGGGTAAADNGPCRPYLVVPVVVRHPRPGQPHIVYRRRICWCVPGGN